MSCWSAADLIGVACHDSFVGEAAHPYRRLPSDTAFAYDPPMLMRRPKEPSTEAVAVFMMAQNSMR